MTSTEDVKHNPWSVSNIDEFLFFCCPECDNKTQSRTHFINHAYLYHPRARETLPQIDEDFDDSINDDPDNKDALTKLEDDPEEEIDEEEPINDEDTTDELFEDMPSYTDSEDLDTKPPNKAKTKKKRKTSSSDSTTSEDCQCYYCGEMVSKKDIQDHMKSSHGRFHRKMFGTPRPLQCQVCKATFAKQSALTTHSCYTNFIPTKVRGGDPYRCEICKKTFTVKMGLRSHLNTVHSEERKFLCQSCDFRAKSIVILNRHVERVHKNNLKHLCSHCGKKFFRAYDLRCHIHRVHKDIQGTEGQTCNFKCEHCSERFLDRRALTWHQKKAHNIAPIQQDKFFTCEMCGQSFQTLHKLAVHKTIKHKEPIAIPTIAEEQIS